MCIKSDFKKWNELEKKSHRNKTKIGILRDQINLLEKETNKNPFNFLQNSNNIDLCNKKQNQLKRENINIEDEIKKIPKHIKSELCDSLLDYFNKKKQKSKLDADLAIEKVKTDIKKKKIRKGLNITGSSLLLMLSIYIIRKRVQ